MLVSIEDVLGATSNDVDTSRLSSSSNNDIYEAYIFFLVIDAARTEGATISYKDWRGNTAQSLVFRTSPGVIYSRAHDYTHALIEFNGAPSLEAHVGIKLVGKSLVSHEADVAVLNGDCN